MSRKELVKRYLLLVLSLFFSALGVAITKHGELGVSPISSIPNVLSCQFTFMTLGNWLIVWNCALIAAQALMLRRDFRKIELLQIPVSLLFGFFTDLGTRMIACVPVQSYLTRLFLVALGTLVLGFGIALSVIANVTMNPGEAVVRTVAAKTRGNFGNIKIALDVSYVAASVLLSLLLFRGRVVGVREGTVIAAVFTGMAVKLFTRLLKKPLEPLLTGRR